MLLLRKQARLVFVHGRMTLGKPPLCDESEITALGFLNQVGAFDDQAVEVIRDACVDLFFLTHDKVKKGFTVQNAP